MKLSNLSKTSILLFVCYGVDKCVAILRQLIIARQFGLSVELDVFNIANNLPDMLFTLITGLIYACALMRPSKSVMDLELKSVKKKFKSPAFAANVDREVIAKGAERLGMPLDDVINETILGMREIADEIGLAGVAEG